MALYRAGERKAAFTVLEQSNELPGGGYSFNWFFLAMIHEQQGDKEKARKCYDQAVEWMAKYMPEDEELHRLRAESAAMLHLEEPAKSKE